MEIKHESICWHCSNRACSWISEFKPVSGWKASPTVITGYYHQTSFDVSECPEFKADKVGCELDDEAVQRLSEAILLQAVADWKALCGAPKARYIGGLVKRDELAAFFNSKQFREMLRLTTSVTDDSVREALGVPTK